MSLEQHKDGENSRVAIQAVNLIYAKKLARSINNLWIKQRIHAVCSGEENHHLQENIGGISSHFRKHSVQYNTLLVI